MSAALNTWQFRPGTTGCSTHGDDIDGNRKNMLAAAFSVASLMPINESGESGNFYDYCAELQRTEDNDEPSNFPELYEAITSVCPSICHAIMGYRHDEIAGWTSLGRETHEEHGNFYPDEEYRRFNFIAFARWYIKKTGLCISCLIYKSVHRGLCGTCNEKRKEKTRTICLEKEKSRNRKRRASANKYATDVLRGRVKELHRILEMAKVVIDDLLNDLRAAQDASIADAEHTIKLEKLKRQQQAGWVTLPQARRAHKQHRRQSRKHKKELLEQCGYRCKYCGVKVTDKTATIDHIRELQSHALHELLPIERSAASHIENLQILCSRCNGRKGVRERTNRLKKRGIQKELL